jgi:hypothetical protein
MVVVKKRRMELEGVAERGSLYRAFDVGVGPAFSGSKMCSRFRAEFIRINISDAKVLVTC